jgi:hypothetical protein
MLHNSDQVILVSETLWEKLKESLVDTRRNTAAQMGLPFNPGTILGGTKVFAVPDEEALTIPGMGLETLIIGDVVDVLKLMYANRLIRTLKTYLHEGLECNF